MNLQTVLNELQALGTEQTKKTYKNHGAHEPLFGVTVGAMIAGQIGKVTVAMDKTSCKTPIALDYIRKAVDIGRIGFKRKNVRC